MITLACISFRKLFIDAFSDESIKIDYYTDSHKISFKNYDGVIIHDDYNTDKIIKEVHFLNINGINLIYILQSTLNNILVKELMNYKIKDYISLEYGYDYLKKKLINDYITIDDDLVYHYKGLVVNYALCQASIDYEDIRLTNKEFEILRLLLMNINSVVSKEEIFKEVWQTSHLEDVRTLDTHIKTLRAKLREYRKCILTVWNNGYAFVDKDFNKRVENEYKDK